jgi:hypothetical protein
MTPANLENKEGEIQLTEKELDALYLYLDMYMEGMSDEEKMFWIEILSRVDKEFYDDTGNGADKLQDVQSPEGGT